ncbi:MAG: hypothetical protein ABIW76_01820 [Fibrobacteria bacterium]
MKTWPSWLRLLSSLLPIWTGAVAAAASEPFYPRIERPKVYCSLVSLYGTASDRRHIRDFGGAFEMPAGETWTAVARFRYLNVEQEEWNEQERGDNVYANSFPSEYRVLGFQAALRRHPWEWMPGFFAEALLGYKRISGGATSAMETFMDGPAFGSNVTTYTNHALETAIGFGYLWEMKRLRIALGYAFGPEFLFRNSRYNDGTTQASSELLELLRFNQLEVGYSF